MTNRERNGRAGAPIDRRVALRLLGGACLGAGAAVARPAGAWPLLMSPVPPDPNAAAVPGATPMLTRAIPSSGEKIPAIGLGTSGAFEVGTSAAARAPLGEVMRAFADAGGKLVDTSPMYGAAETVIGDLTARLGLTGKLFIATKVWETGKDAGIRQIETSMKRLRVERLDLVQVHNLVDLQTQLNTLAAWKKEGRIRYLGVTHYQANAHEELAHVLETRTVDFLQVNYSVGEREAELRLLPLAAARGVAVIANRPFARGDLLRRLRNRPLPPWAADIDCRSWAQILLKYAISHPAITCAIPATSKVEHLRDNMAAGTGRLPDEKQRGRIVAEIVGV
jgi:diketogulonate reductase-like aldo/keto reductase